MMESSETELPFVGKKTSLLCDSGERIDVVIHPDGTRDVSFSGPGEEAGAHVVRLDPSTACALGALLCAALPRPAAG